MCPRHADRMAKGVDPDQEQSDLGQLYFLRPTYVYERWHDKTNKVVYAPSWDSDQPGHPPSLIRVFAVRMKKAWILSYPLRAQQRLWSDRVDAQADLSLRWAHMSVYWFSHEAAQMLMCPKHADRMAKRWILIMNSLIWVSSISSDLYFRVYLGHKTLRYMGT